MLLGNNIVIFRTILVGHIIMIVSWAIENNLVYLRFMTVIISWSYPLVGL